MDSPETDWATTPVITKNPRIISALVVNRSPSGTLRTSSDQVLFQQTSESIQPYRPTDIPEVAALFTESSEVDILQEEDYLPSASTTVSMIVTMQTYFVFFFLILILFTI